MTYSTTVLGDSPVSYWRLGEPSGTSAADGAGSNTGTYTNAPTLAVAGALNTDADTAVTFASASSQSVQMAGQIVSALTNASVEAWVKTSTAANMVIYCERAAAGSDIWKMGIDNVGDLDFTHRDNAGTFTYSGLTTTNVANGAWHYVVVTKAGTSVRLYIDGTVHATTVTLGGGNTLTNAGLAAWIGGDKGDATRYFNGTIDEVAVYNVTLTGTQVTAHWRAGLSAFATPPTASLTTSPFVPTVTASDNKLVTVPVAALTLTTFAPTVTSGSNQVVTVPLATLTTAAFAPQVNLGIVPPTASLALTAFAPTVTASDLKTVVPGTAALVLTTFVPGVGAPVTATPSTATLSMTAFAPNVVATDNKVAVPATAALTLTTFAPTVSAPRLVVPATAALALTAFAPGVVATDLKVATPGTAALTTATFAPSVLVDAAAAVVGGSGPQVVGATGASPAASGALTAPLGGGPAGTPSGSGVHA